MYPDIETANICPCTLIVTDITMKFSGYFSLFVNDFAIGCHIMHKYINYKNKFS